MKQLTLLLSALVWISGCVSAPSVQMVPDVVVDASVAEPRGEWGNWWTPLNDDVLDKLINRGLNGNPSPRIAAARLAQAEAELAVARSARWPLLQASGTRDVSDFAGREPDVRSDQGSLVLGWDVGLWGKRQLEIEDARQLHAQRWFEHQSVDLQLSTLIARTYYRIVELSMQTSLLAAQIQINRDLERLIEARFRRGQAPANELYQQREETTVLQQLKLVNDTSRDVLERSLDVLLGEPPDAESRVNHSGIPVPPFEIGTPSSEDLIRHRADIRAGYARLQQAAAQVGLRFAERLPALEVTVLLTSLTAKHTSAEWVGHVLNLTAPIFTGGRLRSEETRARYVLEEERQRYLDLWLLALEEVSALKWQFEQQQLIIDNLEARRGHAQQALDAARNRYILGDQNYLSVLTALRGLQEADRSLVSERRRLVTLWILATESIGQPMCAAVSLCREKWQL